MFGKSALTRFMLDSQFRPLRNGPSRALVPFRETAASGCLSPVRVGEADLSSVQHNERGRGYKSEPGGV